MPDAGCEQGTPGIDHLGGPNDDRVQTTRRDGVAHVLLGLKLGAGVMPAFLRARLERPRLVDYVSRLDPRVVEDGKRAHVYQAFDRVSERAVDHVDRSAHRAALEVMGGTSHRPAEMEDATDAFHRRVHADRITEIPEDDFEGGIPGPLVWTRAAHEDANGLTALAERVHQPAPDEPGGSGYARLGRTVMRGLRRDGPLTTLVALASDGFGPIDDRSSRRWSDGRLLPGEQSLIEGRDRLLDAVILPHTAGDH